MLLGVEQDRGRTAKGRNGRDQRATIRQVSRQIRGSGTGQRPYCHPLVLSKWGGQRTWSRHSSSGWGLGRTARHQTIRITPQHARSRMCQETGDRMGRIWDWRCRVDCTRISGVPSCPCGRFCRFRPFPYSRAPTTESLKSSPVAVGASLSPWRARSPC